MRDAIAQGGVQEHRNAVARSCCVAPLSHVRLAVVHFPALCQYLLDTGFELGALWLFTSAAANRVGRCEI